MIIGLGTDIADIGRIESIAKHDEKVKRLFTEAEHEYCKSRHHRYQHYAGFWAAKESYRKASGNLFKPMNHLNTYN